MIFTLILTSPHRVESSERSETASAQNSGDWPWWRGPNRNGHADPNQDPPVEWSETENIEWKTPIPGKGHGSPIVVGDHVFLQTSEDDKEIRSLICVDRSSGTVLWSKTVHQGSSTPPKNKKGTQASSTPACDGERVFVNFLHDGAAWTSAVSVDGELLWQTKITKYTVHQGYGSSPLIHEDLVIVSADNKAGGAIAGLRRSDGEIVWKHSRPKMPNYPSPILVTASGKRQLIMTGCEVVTSLNPLTGEVNWEIPGATTECVTSTVTTGDLVFTSGGYPTNHISAVRTDGSGKVAWKNNVRVYVPSMLISDGHLFAVTDAGVSMCWNATTGKEIWKGRLGGTFSSSPVLVNNRIYATNETGTTYVFECSTDRFKLLGKNQLAEICFATPTICGGKIYTRVATGEGKERQESLICISD